MDALRFEVVEFDRQDAREVGAIRAHLAANGTPIGPYGVLIAGQDNCRRTHNTAEFKRVPGLAVEEWQRAS